MRGGAYEGIVPAGEIGARNRYHRNSSDAGALYTAPQPTSARVGEASQTHRMPRIFVFSPYGASFWYISLAKYKNPFTSHDYYQGDP